MPLVEEQWELLPKNDHKLVKTNEWEEQICILR